MRFGRDHCGRANVGRLGSRPYYLLFQALTSIQEMT